MAEGIANKYKVPTGLRPLLEAFARETLRLQPDDLQDFGKLFFDTLYKHKKHNANVDVIEDRVSCDMFISDLQRKYKFLRSNDVGLIDSRPSSPQDIAATKIQAAFRGHYVRNHPERYGIENFELTRGNSADNLNLEENKKNIKRHSNGDCNNIFSSPEERAATKIQAEIRGFLTRKHVDKEKIKSTEAATKIQAHIRGFLARKHLEEKGFVSPSRSYNSLISNKSDET